MPFLLLPAPVPISYEARLELAASVAVSPIDRGPIAGAPGASPSLLRMLLLPVKVYRCSSATTLRRRTRVRPHRGRMWLTATPAPWLAPARWNTPPGALQLPLRNIPYGPGAHGRCRIRSPAERWRRHFFRGRISRRRGILNMPLPPPLSRRGFRTRLVHQLVRRKLYFSRVYVQADVVTL